MNKNPHDDALWSRLVRTPGIGVGIVDIDGDLLFVNQEEMRIFEGVTDVDFEGKNLRDFHAPAFVEERLRVIRQVIESGKPVHFRHIYLGHRVESTIWPLPELDSEKPRVMVISRQVHGLDQSVPAEGIDCVESAYIDLGTLNILSPRELEVFVMLGHGKSIPEVARLLHRSPKTIERHRESIGQKLSLQSQAEIVRIVTDVGLTLDDLQRERLAIDESVS